MTADEMVRLDLDERRLDVRRTGANRRGQRVTNLQPTGRSRMLGTLPGITVRRFARSPVARGMEPSNPCV